MLFSSFHIILPNQWWRQRNMVVLYWMVQKCNFVPYLLFRCRFVDLLLLYHGTFVTVTHWISKSQMIIRKCEIVVLVDGSTHEEYNIYLWIVAPMNNRIICGCYKIIPSDCFLMFVNLFCNPSYGSSISFTRKWKECLAPFGFCIKKWFLVNQ